MKLAHVWTKKSLLSFWIISAAFGILGSQGCGSNSTEGNVDTGLSVNSLSALPSVDQMLSVAASGSSTSLSANQSTSLSSIRAFAVSGTPPVLSDINDSNADAYFWEGLIAQINNLEVDPSDVAVQADFWEGEGSCRMASNVAQSLGNIAQSGTSTCYMSNAPRVLGEDAIVSGTVSSLPELFDQGESDKLVEVQATGDDFGDQNIFIKVFGTDSTEGSTGYAVDLWFCDTTGGSAPTGYQQIRVNRSTGVMTTVEAGQGGDGSGTGVVQFTGVLGVNGSGELVFDPSQTQSANVYFSGSFGTFKGYMAVDGTVLNTKNTNINEFGGSTNTNKVITVANISSNSAGDALFEEAGFGVEWSSGEHSDAFYGGTEYQDSHYVAVNTGTLYESVLNYDFGADSFFSAAIDDGVAALVAGAENYSCGETPDIVVAMDMGSEEMQTVRGLCEVDWETSNFCQTESIQQARSLIVSAQQQP